MFIPHISPQTPLEWQLKLHMMQKVLSAIVRINTNTIPSTITEVSCGTFDQIHVNDWHKTAQQLVKTNQP